MYVLLKCGSRRAVRDLN